MYPVSKVELKGVGWRWIVTAFAERGRLDLPLLQKEKQLFYFMLDKTFSTRQFDFNTYCNVTPDW